MYRWIAVLCVGLGFWGSGYAQETAGPPAWAITHMENMIGTWLADNSANVSEREPYDAYSVTWSWGVGNRTVVGRLVGLKESKPLAALWEYRIAWHPAEKKLMMVQWAGDGSYAEGVIVPKGPEMVQSDQMIFNPDGSSNRIAHREKVEGDARRLETYIIGQDGKANKIRESIWRKR